LGPAIAEVARRLGKPLMPWQLHVAEVVTEIDPVTGRFAYDEVGLTVPRQSGKSTLILAKATHRGSATGFFGRRQRMTYTAQTRNKAREKWEEDYAADLKASKTFGPKVTAHFGNGNEHIRFANGSRFGIEANTEKAGHGGTLDEAYVDEAFAQADNRLEQAFSPAMITRVNTQFWWVSTMGWLGEAPFLEPKVDRGRAQVEMGIREGLAYFEWSAPDDVDPEDRDAWRACMPALGHTITEAAIAGELRKMSATVADFRRAYLNQSVPKPTDRDRTPTVIDMDRWAGLAGREPDRPTPVAFAVAVGPDRKWSTIAMAGVRADGGRQVQVVESGRGTTWVPGRIDELVRDWKPVTVALNPAGPAGALLPELARRKIEVLSLTSRDIGQACGNFVDHAEDGSLHHVDQPLLTIAVGAAKKKFKGDLWEWAPREPSVDIAPLQAATFALFGLAAKPATRTGKVW
jgi:phage terminase large subunit-like protein